MDHNGGVKELSRVLWEEKNPMLTWGYNPCVVSMLDILPKLDQAS